ncbi:MAG: BamA/TamA family outer membrane protein [SAR324 cluster bacterium]|nr:BamA/TamA family outer membrane protein [SAR324 cluster bacterium]
MILFAFFIIASHPPKGFTQEISSQAKPAPARKVSSKKPRNSNVDRPIKEKLSKSDLIKKRESGYFVPIPLLAYDPDFGFGAGLRLYYYHNGESSDPFFSSTPYFHRAFAQVFFSTENAKFTLLDLDSPYLWGTLFRLRSRITAASNPASNYFGHGNQSLKRFQVPAALQFHGESHAFSKLQEIEKKLRQVQANGETYAYYYNYTHEVLSWQLTLEHDLAGGFVRALGGFRFEESEIADYSGRHVSVSDSKEGIMGNTLLREDYEAGNIVGFRGGMDNIIKLGIAFDSRDYEPAPKKGIFADFVIESSEPLLGSDFNYTRVVATLRGYHSPFPKKAKLVIAGRGMLYGYQGAVPFFNLATISDTQGKFRGLGGRRTLRGYKQDRFVGNAGALLNFELRWDLAELELFEQHFAFLFTPFVDLGRVFDDSKKATLNNWKQGEGLGLRIAWNQATVIALEIAKSHEDSGAYLLFNHTF